MGKLYNMGLWPEPEKRVYYEKFQGISYENDGRPWSVDEDERLVELGKHWGVGFGDAWLYMSHDLDRPPAEVRDRWVEVVLKPQQRQGKCELVLSKCTQPLLMNRHFRILPPTVFVVPSEDNYPTKKVDFRVPPGLTMYRDPTNFATANTDR